jgi:hypothetical protein
MTEINPGKMRTLRNWVGDGVITYAQMKMLVDKGNVPPKKLRETLVRYDDLKKWGVVV